MTRSLSTYPAILRFLRVMIWLLLPAPVALHAAEPTPAALMAYDAYVHTLSDRLTLQHRQPQTFLALSATDRERVLGGELVLAPVPLTTASPHPPGVMLHDWRGTAFAPGATLADLEHLLAAFDRYPKVYAPQVLSAHVLSGVGGHSRVILRVRKQHVLTVVLDTTYDVRFDQLDALHGTSVSASKHIAEIADAGTPAEHPLPPGGEHGFLWRLDTFWSYEQRDGGLYLQVETVSLTRAIPRGLGWAIQPLVETVPRDSLTFTLRATVNALAKSRKGDLR